MVDIKLLPHTFATFCDVDERVVIVGVSGGCRLLIFVVVVFLFGLSLVLNV